MGFTDFLIIYLACGAPFGVYHFVQNRKTSGLGRSLSGAFLRFVFWIPFAVAMVVRRSSLANLYTLGFDGVTNSDSKRSREISSIRRRIEDLAAANTDLSVFDCREVVERFIGLSEELQNVRTESVSTEAEIFAVAGHPNKAVASACLRRQVKRKLEFHLELARRDLVSVADAAGDGAAANLRDEIDRLDAFFASPYGAVEIRSRTLQNQPRKHVSRVESELWPVTQQQLPNDTKVSLSMNSIAVATKLSSKD